MQSHLQQLDSEIAASLRGLDAAQTQLSPGNDSARWSIQQVMEHLLLTYTSTCVQFEARIAKGTPMRTQPTLVQQASQWAVCHFGYFPHGRRAPTAVTARDSTTPASGEMLTAQAHDALANLDTLSRATQQLFGAQRSAVHHVLGPLNSQQWLRFHLVHGRHHLRQVYAIRAAHKI